MRFRFNSCVRNNGESVAAFPARLWELADKCKYQADIIIIIVKELARDHLVCGIHDDCLQRRLLIEPNLTYDKAFELAQIHEAAERNAKELRTAQPGISVHATFHTKPDRPARPCYRCGGKHKHSDCFYRSANCNACGKKGHIAKVCRSMEDSDRKRSPTTSTGNRKSERTHQVTTPETTPETAATESDTTIFDNWCLLGQRPNNPFMVNLMLNDATVKMEVDTDASASLISMRTYQKLWPSSQAPPLDPMNAKLWTYMGEELALKGRLTVRRTARSNTSSPSGGRLWT